MRPPFARERCAASCFQYASAAAAGAPSGRGTAPRCRPLSRSQRSPRFSSRRPLHSDRNASCSQPQDPLPSWSRRPWIAVPREESRAVIVDRAERRAWTQVCVNVTGPKPPILDAHEVSCVRRGGASLGIVCPRLSTCCQNTYLSFYAQTYVCRHANPRPPFLLWSPVRLSRGSL
jgi:hypothetical protein